MQIKRGNEVDFDAEKMLVGEWALSTDKRIVRICVAPNVCIRMATYDAFEADVAKIQGILEEVQTIEEAVTRINTEISEKANAVAEYTEQAKGYRDETKQFRDGAETSATNAKSSEDKAKFSETNAKVSETNAKISEENAQRVAESLPEDYTDLSKAFYNTAIKQKAVGENIHVTDSAEAKNIEFGLYGKAEQNGEPTPDNPIEITVSGSDGSVEVVSCGKNLADGINATFATDNTSEKNITGLIHLMPGTYTLSWVQDVNLVSNTRNTPTYGVVGNYEATQKYQGTGANRNLNAGRYSWTITIKEENDYRFSYWVHRPSADVTISDIQLEKNAEMTEYQPRSKTSSTIPTPDGLAGIKVSSGGNYTDENGQQWVCDEIVKYADGSGKRIQRVLSVDLASVGWARTTSYANPFFYGNIPNKKVGITNGLCTAFVFDNANINASTFGSDAKDNSFAFVHTNMQILIRCDAYSDVESFKTAMQGFKVYYELAEPIITDLSAEEIAEFEKLHTFYPITNISNDAECGMSITYMADAKNYIDNRLALIESAMLNNI